MKESNSIHIVADSKIPFLRGVFESVANIEYLDPSEMDKERVKNVEALIVRTRTRCNAELLEGSKVKKIATATIGYDHIDRAYCQSEGISWSNAPGCNATSVAQYVLSSLILIARNRECELSSLKIGLIGVGYVGKAVEALLSKMGLEVRRCDPPRQRVEPEETFYTKEELAEWADVVSIHTPLTRDGLDPTFAMLDTNFFGRLKSKVAIINSSRGEVIDELAMLEAEGKGLVSEMIIDCWNNEPHINNELLDKAFIATPHIAGYSADGKANATRMASEVIADYFDLRVNTATIVPPEIEGSNIDMKGKTLEDAILLTYDPREDMARLKADVVSFEKQRGDYPLRREYVAYSLIDIKDEDKTLAESLGFMI